MPCLQSINIQVQALLKFKHFFKTCALCVIFSYKHHSWITHLTAGGLMTMICSMSQILDQEEEEARDFSCHVKMPPTLCNFTA